jgi:hypothetical protein
MIEHIKVGDIVHLCETENPWRVVCVDLDRDYVRLERVGEAWVRTRVIAPDDLHPYRDPEGRKDEN